MITVINLDGRPLAFGSVVRTVMTLKSGATRGLSLERVLLVGDEHRAADAGLKRLTEYDRERVDQWILRGGLAAVTDPEGHQRGSVLFAPVCFSTLAGARSRRIIMAELGLAQARLAMNVVLEVTTLDPGLPPSRLVEVLTALKPAVKFVFARVRPEPKAVKALIDCGFSGVALDAVDIANPEDEPLMTRIRLAMEAVGPRMIVHNLHTVTAINAARAAGVTYATLDIGRAADIADAPDAALVGAAAADQAATAPS